MFSQNKVSTLSFKFDSDCNWDFSKKITSGRFLKLKALVLFMETCWIYFFLSCSSFIKKNFKKFLEFLQQVTWLRGKFCKILGNFVSVHEISWQLPWIQHDGSHLCDFSDTNCKKKPWCEFLVKETNRLPPHGNKNRISIQVSCHLSRKTATYEIGKDLMGAGGVEMSGRGWWLRLDINQKLFYLRDWMGVKCVNPI